MRKVLYIFFALFVSSVFIGVGPLATGSSDDEELMMEGTRYLRSLEDNVYQILPQGCPIESDTEEVMDSYIWSGIAREAVIKGSGSGSVKVSRKLKSCEYGVRGLVVNRGCSPVVVKMLRDGSEIEKVTLQKDQQFHSKVYVFAKVGAGKYSLKLTCKGKHQCNTRGVITSVS